MEKIETGFQGLFVIKPVVYSDNRGYFFESFNYETFRNEGISFNQVQDNESRSAKGVIRGLHYQLKPHDQAKLIRVIEGKIYDVALDIRKNSPTYGILFDVELASESKTQLFIPKGFAHGFSVLSEFAVILYKTDNVYNRLSERGIALDDPDLRIDWKTGDIKPVISEKDMRNPPLKEADNNF